MDGLLSKFRMNKRREASKLPAESLLFTLSACQCVPLRHDSVSTVFLLIKHWQRGCFEAFGACIGNFLGSLPAAFLLLLLASVCTSFPKPTLTQGKSIKLLTRLCLASHTCADKALASSSSQLGLKTKTQLLFLGETCWDLCLLPGNRAHISVQQKLHITISCVLFSMFILKDRDRYVTYGPFSSSYCWIVKGNVTDVHTQAHAVSLQLKHCLIRKTLFYLQNENFLIQVVCF